jgi:hypothetical protein
MKVLTVIVLAITLSAAPQQTPKEPPAPSKRVQTEMSGCVDQQKEEFVLTSPADMTVLARLKGKGFADDNFARYIGQKVSVRGYATGRVFEVVKIVKLADTCSR